MGWIAHLQVVSLEAVGEDVGSDKGDGVHKVGRVCVEVVASGCVRRGGLLVKGIGWR